MKKTLFLAALLLAAVSCKKSLETSSPPGPGILQAAVVQLKESLSPGDFARLDTTRCYVAVADSGRVNYVRLAFHGVPIAQSFVLLHTDGAGKVSAGRIVDLTDLGSSGRFDSGSVTLRSLGGRMLMQSEIRKGFVLASLSGVQVPAPGSKTPFSIDPGDDDDGDGGLEILPEVIVYPSGSSGDTYYSLSDLLGGSGGSSYYGPAYPPGGGVSSPVVAALTLKASAEYSNSLPVINLKSYFNCFSLADPDGATYTLQLCTDIPVNGDPGASYDISSGTVTAGHSFLVVTMSGTGGSVTQSFGFYPATVPAFWNPALPVSSEIKDNGGHEINASITISISSAQLATVQARAAAYAQNQYSLVYYNCTDYALGVFNSVATTPIGCQPFSGYVQTGASTTPAPFSMVNSPEGLYNSLAALKAGGGPLAPSIKTDPTSNTASPASHGACP